MVNIRIKDQQKASSSPRGEVGEIDTRAPFQSVKAAVSLFGSVSKEKPAVKKKLSSENVLDKETQLLLAQREINKVKHQLESAETAKARALVELEKNKRTLDDLTNKLRAVTESKLAAMEVAEEVKEKAKQLEVALSKKAIGTEAKKQELEHARKEYTTTVTALDASKQELTKIRQDFDAALEAKLAAFQSAAEAQRSANINTERVNELSREIAAMKASVQQLKVASLQAQEEQAKIMAEKEAHLESYRTAKEAAEKQLISLKEELDPEQTQALEEKFAQTRSEIEVLQEEMKKAHASEMDTVRAITSELNEATKALNKVAEEETTLRNLVNSLKTELESVKREQDELKEKAGGAAESHAVNQNLALQELISESEGARREAEEANKKAQELKQEAEAAKLVTEEAQKKLELLLKEVEEAKEAEKRVLDEMKILSQNQGGFGEWGSSPKIKLTLEEFEALSRKTEESQELIEKTEATTRVELEEINQRKNEIEKKLEANLKAIEEIKTATEIALKNTEIAESAKLMVEGELMRWRQQEEL